MNKWQPIDTAPDKQWVLVTNNIDGRNSYGHMSHVWLVRGFFDTQTKDGFLAYTDDGLKLHNLTHWLPLPLLNNPDE